MTSRIGSGADLPVLDFDGAERTGGHTDAAADAQLHGQYHRRFPGILLLENFMSARPGGPAQPVLRIAGRGITFLEVDIGVLVHALRPGFINPAPPSDRLLYSKISIIPI